MTNVGTEGHIDNGKKDIIVIGGRGLSGVMVRALLEAGKSVEFIDTVRPLDYMDFSTHDVVRRHSSNPCNGLNENGIPRKRKKGR